jgi:hypothetical protein
MAPEFALLQRWYSTIEFGNQPFSEVKSLSSQVGDLTAPNGVTVRNGVSGRSSHYCLHGNGATFVRVHNFVCQDFEVAGFALNGFKHLEIRDVVVKRNRQEVPVYSLWSSGRFILPYLESLVKSGSDVTLNVNGVCKTV